MHDFASKQRRNTYVKERSSQTVIDVDTARKECYQDFTSDDEIIIGCLKAAQTQAEVILRRSLTEKTLVLQMDCFPYEKFIQLEQGRVKRVVEVRYVDSNGDSQVLSDSLYTLDNKCVPDLIHLNVNESWPSTLSGQRNAVEVEYVTGEEDLTLISPTIIKAIKYLTKHFYDNPDMVVIGAGQPVEVPKTAEYLLWPERDYRF